MFIGLHTLLKNGNITEVNTCVDLIDKYKLMVIDISQYVPGDTDICDEPQDVDSVCEYHVRGAAYDVLKSRLGERWSGMDNGEQDGRYCYYAGQVASPSAVGSYAEQFSQFMRHFQRMTDDLGSRMMSLNSLYYPHYFAKTGLYTMVAAETAQGLPNANLFYAFLRGAAKAFAALLWGNVSVYNCFRFKTCNATSCTGNGTSLSLMKRLMYSQLLMGYLFLALKATSLVRGLS